MKKQYSSPSMEAHALSAEPMLTTQSNQIPVTNQSGPSKAKALNFVGGDDDTDLW